MFRILVVPVLVAIAVSGCSKTEDAKMPQVMDSVAKPTADPAPHAEMAPKNPDLSAANSEVKDSAPQTKNAARKTSEKAKKGTGLVREAHSSTAKDWRNFQVLVKKCETTTTAENKQCLTDARNTYRAWNLNCETLPPEDEAQCTRYVEQWTSALADAPHANTPAVRSGEPNAIPADAGDPSDKERNRDSTKQQAATQQPSKQN
jgi:hypothetical protein